MPKRGNSRIQPFDRSRPLPSDTEQLPLPFMVPQAARPELGLRETLQPPAEKERHGLPDIPSVAAAFVRVFRRMELRRPLPDFHVEYRPYTGLRSTVHLLGNRVNVQISDVLAESPLIVLEALAEILLAKLFRRRPSREARSEE